MAAAIAPALPTIDLKNQASYPLRLGSSIVQRSDAKRFRSLRYNHRPAFKRPTEVDASLQAEGNGRDVELVVRDAGDKFKYSGRSVSSDGWYVFLTKEAGTETDIVVEKLDGSYDFNLVATPGGNNTERLAEEFPQLSFVEQESSTGKDDDVAEPADPNNPWDYRHYMKSTPSRTTTRPEESAAASAAKSRALGSSQASQKPTGRSHTAGEKKRRTQEPSTAASKRVKAGTDPPRAAAVNAAKSTRNIPQVRIERKASVRRPSIDDSGELILENETPVTEKPPKRTTAMSLALSGQLGQGPISLRSAASSPASRNASPMPPRPQDLSDDGEFEFGNDSPPHHESQTAQEGDYFEGTIDDEADDADADVEDLELPSPAQNRNKGDTNPGENGDAEEEDDDLDAQLALAMAEADDAGPPAAGAESDEESEEE